MQEKWTDRSSGQAGAMEDKSREKTGTGDRQGQWKGIGA
jgi:hypothetical protein